VIKIVHVDDVRQWWAQSGSLSERTRSIGAKHMDAEYMESVFGMPLHLRFAIARLARERAGELPAEALDSIPFYSLCKGLFLPLSALSKDKAAQLFGLETGDPPTGQARQDLIDGFLQKPIGLGFSHKIACLLGDPFFGGSGGFRRDSLLRILQREVLARRTDVLDRLTRVGDIAVMWAQSRPVTRAQPPLTALEVLETLRLVSRHASAASRLSRENDPILSSGRIGRNEQLAVLQSLYQRCGSLEAYFLTKLILRKAGLGFEYDGPGICRHIARNYGAEEDAVADAVALTDTFHVIRLLESLGPDGLRQVALRPLAPIRPALAGGVVDESATYPMWIERKYDGIRFTLHKATDAGGGALCGAYTRNRLDWIELVPGLDTTIKMLPARNIILDGELYGTVFTLDGVRPANVYEVYSALHGQPSAPVTLRFAGFDILYLEGRDLTGLPLHERRRLLAAVLAPLLQFGGSPVPVSLSDGQLAASREDANRLFHHFRAQGYEGIIAKDVNGRYLIGRRDPTWLKRKPEITLDLVLLVATLAVTANAGSGRFGSYAIGARTADGSFVEVGDVAGVDRERDMAIQQAIVRDGLLTGSRVERASSSGARPGFVLRPAIVVTVRFEGIAREATGSLSLRDPKLVAIRSDKNPGEADLATTLEEIYLRQRVG
jgi:DNA ligase-1